MSIATGECAPVYARHVLITGGTGFIGSALVERLLALDIRVSVLTRERNRARRQFNDRVAALESLAELRPEDAPEVIVNLAGKGLESERWNPTVKQALIESRVDTTEHVIEYLHHGGAGRTRLLISGSAVGYYGARGERRLTEEDEPGDEFQSRLCRQWEASALRAEPLGIRVCLSRTGVVLGSGGGMLGGLTPVFRAGLGAVAGSGRQWISWIHIEDLLDLFLRFMADESLSGAFNNTAPGPVTNREFSRALGSSLNRPVWLRAPGWALHLLKGPMAHLYLTGQRVIPARHLADGHVYRYPDIRSGLDNVLERERRDATK